MSTVSPPVGLDERTTPGAWGKDWRDTERELTEIWLSQPDAFQSLIEPREAADVPYASDVAHVKRFAERWRADRAFREALPADPYGVAARYALRADPDELRCLWDETFAAGRGERWIAPLVVQRYRLFAREKLLHREKLRAVDCVPSDERHRRWRERQVRRTLGHLGARQHDGIIHAPFAIELSDGCTVGCWFCGVSAGRKRGDFLYTDDNGRLWRDVLRVLRAAVGPSAATGFCYWATDPLDNPAYERFAVDFAEICGRFPQTTTAQPLADVARTRALLALSIAHGCTINRFSTLTLRAFDGVMAAFTPEELLHCEIVSQNPEAVHIQGNAGRARGSARLGRLARAHGLETDEWQRIPGTIACVSGFLLNMVERRVRLITPCPSSDRWRDGYWVLADRRFTGADDLAKVIDGMMADAMPSAARDTDAARFRPDLRFRPLEGGFELAGFGATTRFEGPPRMRELGAAIAAGDRTVGGLVAELAERYGRPAESTRRLVAQLFDGGCLDEEPRG